MNLDDDELYCDGLIWDGDRIALVVRNVELEQEDIPHSMFLIYDNGRWIAPGTRDWNAVSMCVTERPQQEWVVLSEDGNVFCADRNSSYDETIPVDLDLGPMRGLGVVEGQAYAVGMGPQAFRRDGRQTWVPINQGFITLQQGEDIAGIEGIAGYSASDMYAVGWEGEIWHFDGQIWNREHSPTNFILSSVCCAGDGYVYTCGRQGTIIRGGKQNWELLAKDEINEDFWSIVEYKDQIFLSSMYGIYKLKNGRIEFIDIDSKEDEAITYCHLSVANDLMCSVGEKHIILFDGAAWKIIGQE